MGTWWRWSRAAFVLAVWLLSTACATGTGLERGRGVSKDEEAVLAQLPMDFAPVQVSDAEWTAALATLWLDTPLRVSASPGPLPVGRRLALASVSEGGSEASDLTRAYGRYCERCGTPGDCLTLLGDGSRFEDDDKRELALALALSPALEGARAEGRALLNPTHLLATISLGITVYMAVMLAPIPEPVTKAGALFFSAALWGYLGFEFFDLIRAYVRLSEEAPRASSFEELREVGERFGRVIGPNSVRILVIVGTAALGETAALAARGSKLPGFTQASERVSASTGLSLLDAATGTGRVIVSVPERALHVVLAPTVAAMAARGLGTGPGRGKLLPSGHRAWKSYSGFKSAMGPAGPGREWHHLVEQTPGNVKRFGGEVLHNTENVIAMDKAIHTRLSALFSSKFLRITGSRFLTVRQWLSTQSYEAQRQFGLLAARNIQNGTWP